MRKRIFEVIEVAKDSDRASTLYDFAMMFVIFLSLIPLAFKRETFAFVVIDRVTVSVFVVDYILRLCTADIKYKSKGAAAFFYYPITPMALIDLVSILPSVTSLNGAFRILKVFRLLRTFRVMRVFKFLRYSKSFRIIKNVFVKQRSTLEAVLVLSVAYIAISALVIFNVEPESFDTFFDAIYWAAVSLTTMGYGDIYPVTPIGRVVTVVSAFVGIAIVALPAGIITAGYMDEIQGKDED